MQSLYQCKFNNSCRISPFMMRFIGYSFLQRVRNRIIVNFWGQGSHGQDTSGKSIVLRSGMVRKSQEILLKHEESQDKVRKLYQSNKFCDAQLWSYINVQRSLVKFKTQACRLNCKYTICNAKMSCHKVRVKLKHAECESQTAKSIFHALLQGLDFNYLVYSCRLQVPQRVCGCDPSTDKRAICRAIVSPLHRNNSVVESPMFSLPLFHTKVLEVRVHNCLALPL